MTGAYPHKAETRADEGEFCKKYYDYRVGGDRGILDRIDGYSSSAEPRWSSVTIRVENAAFLGMSFMLTHLLMYILSWPVAAGGVIAAAMSIASIKFIYFPMWRDRKVDFCTESALAIIGAGLAVWL